MDDIIDLSMDFSGKTNFGGGIELLMNEKKHDRGVGGGGGDIDISDLDHLENEINELSGNKGKFFSNNDDAVSVTFDEEPSIRILEDPPSSSSFSSSSSSLGRSTANLESDTKTWDGYGKFNNIPMNPDKRMSGGGGGGGTRDENMQQKFKYLKLLEGLERKGASLTKKYNMDSDLQEMMGEYEMMMEEKSKQTSIKLQSKMMMLLINGIEFFNNRFDPFDINLDGWGDQVNENVEDYDDVFGELYEKYKGKASIAPEVKLLFQLGGSAVMVHMSNSLVKSSGIPGMDDMLRQNPDLMRHFQQAAVNSMAGANPGFAGFMGGLMKSPEPTVPLGRVPPPPVATQRPQNGGGGERPDISMARNHQSPLPPNNNTNNNNNMYRGNNQFNDPPMPVQRSSRRPDMKGPSDISSILSGLKTKTIEIPKDEGSTISYEDAKSIQGDGTLPKRSRRKPTSNKNTVSLDI